MDAADPAELPRELIFVDLETTGCDSARHRITEIGLVRFENGAQVEEWSSLVNPECRIPDYIEGFTGISDEMVAAAPRFAELAPLVLEKLRPPARPQTPLLVAHNARFDYGFLRAEFRRVGIKFSASVLCTVKLSRRLYPEHPRHNLDALMQRHGLACEARHRALGDARVLADFWRTLRAQIPEARLAEAALSVLGTDRLPAHLPAELADELPEGPGVYRLFGAGEALLYVGKSSALRAQVLKHFADGGEKMAAEVVRVDWFETIGEFGAALREAEYLKTHQPLWNRRSRPHGGCVTLHVSEQSGEVKIVPAAGMEAGELARHYGAFHSQSDARKALLEIARAHRLCAKRLGQEEGPGSCVGYQLGTCKGACVGEEPLILHAVRVQMALSSLKLKPWPFPGRIAVRERGAAGASELHVLDHWAYLGSARGEEALADLALRDSPPLDARIYRLLLRFLAKHPQLEWIDLARRAGRSIEAFE